jgi:uncharacterized protein (TIGR02646 family)
MRTIHKGKEPSAWVEFRSRASASFDSVDAPKDELRHALVSEQCGLCCYCLGRIEADPRRMKLEHWACQSKHPSRQLDYGNILGACLGGDGGPPTLRHCDTAKGDTNIGVDPTDPHRDCSGLFTYWANGEIRPARDDDSRLAARLEAADANGNLKPFCQAAIFWLRRQARKRSPTRA